MDSGLLAKTFLFWSCQGSTWNILSLTSEWFLSTVFMFQEDSQTTERKLTCRKFDTNIWYTAPHFHWATTGQKPWQGCCSVGFWALGHSGLNVYAQFLIPTGEKKVAVIQGALGGSILPVVHWVVIFVSCVFAIWAEEEEGTNCISTAGFSVPAL